MVCNQSRSVTPPPPPFTCTHLDVIFQGFGGKKRETVVPRDDNLALLPGWGDEGALFTVFGKLVVFESS